MTCDVKAPENGGQVMSTIHEIPTSLKNYLTTNGVPFEVLQHPRDFSAQRTAADTHTPGRAFAKCVLVWIDNYYAMIVLPAHHRVDFDLLRDELGAKDAGLVREEEMHRLFPDCEIGAEPPFGKLYDLPVYVAAPLAEDATITFNAGTHDEAIRMTFADFQGLTEPSVIECSAVVTQ
jgi:Ala-tRNA(Pro) deacylase